MGLALLTLLIGFLGSLRRVEFSGDMQPTFDFRWQTSREAKLDSYLASEPSGEIAAGLINKTHNAELPAVSPPMPPRILRAIVARTPQALSSGRRSRDWQRHPPRCLWRHPCGGGYASYAVIGDSAVTLEQRGSDEVVVCYDIETGRHRWKYAYPALFSEKLGGDGPRATPTIHGRYVYSLGASGDLVKLDFATGEFEWRVNILAENSSGNLEWGMSGSPLVVDGRIIVNPGTQQGTEASADVLATQ